jgi:transcriptional regulatory protein RtcR
MTTLAAGARITTPLVKDEIERLTSAWKQAEADGDAAGHLERVLGAEGASRLDRFDRVQLADVLNVCSTSTTLSDAGRVLFGVSRKQRSKVNDADRLRKYLARFDLSWRDIRVDSAGEP